MVLLWHVLLILAKEFFFQKIKKQEINLLEKTELIFPPLPGNKEINLDSGKIALIISWIKLSSFIINYFLDKSFSIN